jgi:hypothetical protein
VRHGDAIRPPLVNRLYTTFKHCVLSTSREPDLELFVLHAILISLFLDLHNTTPSQLSFPVVNVLARFWMHANLIRIKL